MKKARTKATPQTKGKMKWLIPLIAIIVVALVFGMVSEDDPADHPGEAKIPSSASTLAGR